MEIKVHIPEDNGTCESFCYIDEKGYSVDYDSISIIDKIRTIYALCAMLKFLSK